MFGKIELMYWCIFNDYMQAFTFGQVLCMLRSNVYNLYCIPPPSSYRDVLASHLSWFLTIHLYLSWLWIVMYLFAFLGHCQDNDALNLFSSLRNRWVCLTSVHLFALYHWRFISLVSQVNTTARAWPAWTSQPSKVFNRAKFTCKLN